MNCSDLCVCVYFLGIVWPMRFVDYLNPNRIGLYWACRWNKSIDWNNVFLFKFNFVLFWFHFSSDGELVECDLFDWFCYRFCKVKLQASEEQWTHASKFRRNYLKLSCFHIFLNPHLFIYLFFHWYSIYFDISRV